MLKNTDYMRVANNLDRLERAYGGKIPTGYIDMNALNRDLNATEIMLMANELKRVDFFRHDNRPASKEGNIASIVGIVAVIIYFLIGFLRTL